MTAKALARAIPVALLLTAAGITSAEAQTPMLGPAPSRLFHPAEAMPLAATAHPVPLPAAGDSTESGGALNGALVGAGIVGALGLLAGAWFCDEGCDTGAKWQSGFGGLLMGATAGFALGGIIGSF